MQDKNAKDVKEEKTEGPKTVCYDGNGFSLKITTDDPEELESIRIGNLMTRRERRVEEKIRERERSLEVLQENDEEESMAFDIEDPEGLRDVYSVQRRERWEKALSELTFDQKVLMYNKFVQNMDDRELALARGVSVRYIRQAVYILRLRLKALVKKYRLYEFRD